MGLDGGRYLEPRDSVERIVLLERAKHVEEMLIRRDRNLAILIVSELGRAFKG